MLPSTRNARKPRANRFATVDSLDELTARAIDAAPLLAGQFLSEEWGGANELHLLTDERLGVLGHITWMQGIGLN